MSEFRIQIVHVGSDEVVTEWAPGSAVEQEFVRAVAAAVVSHSVGVFRTRAQVGTVVEASLREFLRNLKSQVKPT